MAVNVDTDLLRSNGSKAFDNMTACDGPHQGIKGMSDYGINAIKTFKKNLNDSFATFNEHSNKYKDTLHQCAQQLEASDGAIGGAAPAGQTASNDEGTETKIATETTTSKTVYSGSNLQPKNNTNIAHRGHHPGGIWENSKDAFIKAGEEGFWGCETDVGLDAYGNLICSHNSPKYGENPPSFEEYLDVCKKYGMTAIIDLKYYGLGSNESGTLSTKAVQIVKEHGMLDSCVFQTNWVQDVPIIREASDDARIWLLVDDAGYHKQRIIDNNVECVNFNAASGYGNIKNGIKILNEINVDSCVWGVERLDSRNRYLEDGAKYVMSDYLIGSTPYQEGQKDYNNIAN